MQTFRRSGFLMILFLAPFFVHAEVYINEIMYDLSGTDSDREWVEVYNSGSASVDLSSYKFSEATSNHTLHIVSGNFILEAGSYAIISDDPVMFMTDQPSFEGNLFDSAFALNNSGATLSLKDSSGALIDQAVYTSEMGANGNGDSLQRKSDGTWIQAEATAGEVNREEASEPENNIEEDNGTSTTTDTETGGEDHQNYEIISSHYSYIPLSELEFKEEFKVSAGRDRLAVIGNPIEFKAEANTDDGSASYLWSFGDGSTGDGERVEHSYDYAGEYVVILDGEVDKEESISRTSVQVVEPEIVVEEANGQFIRIQNNSNREINLYGFEIKDSSGYFEFPRDTIILPGASVSFSSQVTNLHPESTAETAVKSMSNTKMIIPNKSEFKEEEKDHSDEVAVLMTKALEIQKEIALLTNENQTEQAAVESLPVENVSAPNRVDPNDVAASVLSLPSPSSVSSSTSSTPEKIENSWIETIKHFFLGQ